MPLAPGGEILNALQPPHSSVPAVVMHLPAEPRRGLGDTVSAKEEAPSPGPISGPGTQGPGTTRCVTTCRCPSSVRSRRARLEPGIRPPAAALLGHWVTCDLGIHSPDTHGLSLPGHLGGDTAPMTAWARRRGTADSAAAFPRAHFPTRQTREGEEVPATRVWGTHLPRDLVRDAWRGRLGFLPPSRGDVRAASPLDALKASPCLEPDCHRFGRPRSHYQ